MKRYVGISLLFIAGLIILYLVYANSPLSSTTRTFSSYSLLSSSWDAYRKRFIQDNRVIDFTQNDITTSEGQSYGMLRSVWMGDKTTFDGLWKFTQNNLSRPNDHLFGWRWGKRSDGSYGFLPNGGNNSATDADSDMAFALILADNRWNDAKYSQAAKAILIDMWKYETGTAAGKRYVTAGNWAENANQLVINPSYFAPYEYRLFATVDTSHDWLSLVAPGYDMLETAGQVPLDKSKAVGLPPDWLAIDRKTGQIGAATFSGASSDYSFDAMRVPWRVGLDYQWNHEQRAYTYLQHSFTILADFYTKTGKIPSVIAHDGTVVSSTENPTMYATSLGYFLTIKPDLAKQIYTQKIIRLYSNDSSSFNSDLPYYEQNWLWFGAAFYNKFLTNLE